MLEDKDVKRYNEAGYILIPDVFSSEEIDAMRAAADELVSGAKEVTSHTELYDLEDDHTPEAPRVRRLTNPQNWHPVFAQMVRHPRVIACLTALWGPNVRFDAAKLNMKPAKSAMAIEWHQDWAFYPHTNDDLAAVGIMLDDVDMENGPLMVLPESHKGPILDHHADGHFVGGFDTSKVDLTRAVACTGKSGSITIHHVRTIHGSAPNLSARPRRLLLNQYRAADAWPLIDPPRDFAVYSSLLVAGEETFTPRMEALPARLPYPLPGHPGSIFEVQRDLGRRSIF